MLSLVSPLDSTCVESVRPREKESADPLNSLLCFQSHHWSRFIVIFECLHLLRFLTLEAGHTMLKREQPNIFSIPLSLLGGQQRIAKAR